MKLYILIPLLLVSCAPTDVNPLDRAEDLQPRLIGGAPTYQPLHIILPQRPPVVIPPYLGPAPYCPTCP